MFKVFFHVLSPEVIQFEIGKYDIYSKQNSWFVWEMEIEL